MCDDCAATTSCASTGAAYWLMRWLSRSRSGTCNVCTSVIWLPVNVTDTWTEPYRFCSTEPTIVTVSDVVLPPLSVLVAPEPELVDPLSVDPLPVELLPVEPSPV